MQVGQRGIWTGSPSRRPATADSCPLWQDPRLALDRQWGIFWGSYSLPDPQQQAVAGAGQTVSTRLLFTRRAGVHVDFHAHRHFHNLRSFPTHQASPKQCWHDVRAGIKTRLTSNIAQARNIRRWSHTDASDAGNFPLGQSDFALGQGERPKRLIDACVAPVTVRELGFACRTHLSKTEASAGLQTRLPTLRHRLSFTPQQSLSAVLLSALAPSACCAAVGSPCICRCASCEDAATSPVVRFIVPVGGC